MPPSSHLATFLPPSNLRWGPSSSVRTSQGRLLRCRCLLRVLGGAQQVSVCPGLLMMGLTGPEWLARRAQKGGPGGPPSSPPPPPPQRSINTTQILLIFHQLSLNFSYSLQIHFISQFALIFFNTSFSSIVLHIT